MNNPNWNVISSIISSVCTIFSLYVVFVLYKERKEKSRPYIQISSELIRSNLACLVFRNVGDCLVEIKSIKLNDEFLSNISKVDKSEKIKKLKNTNITISPKQMQILSLDCFIGQLNYKFANITIKYNKYGKRRIYKETVGIDFDNIGIFLDYKSELDEINRTLKNICKNK